MTMYSACGSYFSLVGYQHWGTRDKGCFLPITRCESTAYHKLKLSASQVHTPEFHLQSWGEKHTKYAHSQWKVCQGPKLTGGRKTARRTLWTWRDTPLGGPVCHGHLSYWGPQLEGLLLGRGLKRLSI